MKTESARGNWKGWAKLSLGLACVWLFVFVLAPWISRMEPVKPVLDFVHENDIDAAALFYTEIEEFSEAEIAVRHALNR